MAVRTEELQLRVLIDGSPARRELTTLDQEYAKLNSQQKLLKKGSEEYIATERRKAEIVERQRVLTKEIGNSALTTKQLHTELRRLLAEGRNMRPYTEEWKRNAEAQQRVNAELQKRKALIQQANPALAAQQRAIAANAAQVGGLSGVWNQAKAAALGYVGVGAAVFGIARLIGDGVRIYADFEKAQSRLQAITRATAAEMKMLSDQAKQLGATTIFTASQVVELQTELAKLGFTSGQISAATEGILQLAAAADTDLANAATITAQTLNAFGLQASDTQRLVDVMARSFTTSALDIEKFSASMSNVAPAAKAMGISVEETTASLAKLVDNGIVAEKAGTDLRMIYIQLAKQGLTWNEAQERILNSQDQLSTAVEMFDVRAANSAIILANQSAEVANLSQKLRESAGSAKQMADAQQDNLRGDQLLLTSAWEGFVLSLEDGSGPISRVFRGVTQNLAGVFNEFTKVNKEGATFGERLGAIGRGLARLLSLSPATAGLSNHLMQLFETGDEPMPAEERARLLSDSFNEASASTEDLQKRLELLQERQQTYAELGNQPGVVAAHQKQIENIEAQLRLREMLTNADAEAGNEAAGPAAQQAAAIETVADARARLTAELERERLIRDSLAASDREAIALTDENIAAIEKQLAALEGRKDAEITPTQAQKDAATARMKQLEEALAAARERMYQANLTADEQDLRRLQLKHEQERQSLLANELATAADLEALREVQAQEMADAMAEQAQRRLEQRQQESEEVLNSLLTEQEAALAAEEQKWQQLIATARALGPEYADEVAQLEERMQAALQGIRDRYRAEEEQKQLEDRRRALAEKIETYQAVGTAIAGVNQLLAAAMAASGQANYEQTVAAKALGLAQIAIASGVGVAEAIKSGAGLGFPQNLAAIATGVGAVLSGIAQATALLSAASISQPSFTAPGATAGPGTLTSVPLGEKGGIFEGPSHAQGGLKVYDPRRRRVVAEVEGGEPWMVLSRAFRQKNPGLVPRLLQASAQGTKLGARGGIFAPMPAFNFRSATEAIRMAQGGIVGNGNSQYTFRKGSGGINDGSGLSEMLAILRTVADQTARTAAATERFPTRIQAVASITDFNRRSTEYAQLQQRNKVRRA